MDKTKGQMDEKILVCVYYGPNGERLITRGGRMAQMLDCPLFILTVDPSSKDDQDIERAMYIEKWEQLAQELDAEEFIIKYNEKRPASKVIGEVAREKNITQIVIGESAQSRWKEITKGSFVNVLLHEIPFVDLHIVSVSRALKNQEGYFEKGIRAYLIKEGNDYKLTFNHTKETTYEGIFFKEFGTDFNNGIFKFMKNSKMIKVHVTDDYVTDAKDL